jgi:hypothetical protein
MVEGIGVFLVVENPARPGATAEIHNALEGMNLRVDVLAKRLVPAGPVPAAAA